MARASDKFEKAYSQGVMNVTEIWVGKTTGANYLFHVSGYAGGLAPLLDREGKPVVSLVVSSQYYKIGGADIEDYRNGWRRGLGEYSYLLSNNQ